MTPFSVLKFVISTLFLSKYVHSELDMLDAITKDQVTLHVFCSSPNITEKDVIAYEQCDEPGRPEVIFLIV